MARMETENGEREHDGTLPTLVLGAPCRRLLQPDTARNRSHVRIVAVGNRRQRTNDATIPYDNKFHSILKNTIWQEVAQAVPVSLRKGDSAAEYKT